MNHLVSQQAINFIMAVLNGLFLGLVYDFLRVLRRIIKHADWLVNLEDIIYWVFGSFIIFLEIFKNNDGILRGFLYAGVFLGLIVYFSLISKWVIIIVMNIYTYVKKIVITIFKIVLKPIQLMIRPIIFLAKKICKLLKKIKKWLIIRGRRGFKEVKIILKKI